MVGIDFFAYGYVIEHATRYPKTTKSSFMTLIKEKLGSIDEDMLRKACSLFWCCIKAVIEANGCFKG